MSGIIYDKNSIEKNLINGFAEKLKDEKVMFTQPTSIGDSIHDAGSVGEAGMFIEQQLRQIVPRILGQVLPGMPGLEIVKSIDNSGTYMQAIIQRIESYQGKFADAHEIGDDKGLLTFARDGKEIAIRTKKGYSVYDNITLNRMKMTGENINEALIKVHKITYNQFIDDMIFLGMSDSKGARITEGLANYTGIISGSRLDSDDTFANFVTKEDGFGLYIQIQKLYNKMVGFSEGAEQFMPDTLVLPVEQFSALSTPVNTGDTLKIGTKNVKQYLEDNLGLKIYASKRLKAQGDGGSDRAIMLSSKVIGDPNFTLYIPMPLQFLPIDVIAGDYHINSQFRVAGVSINYNNCIGYLDNI